MADAAPKITIHGNPLTLVGTPVAVGAKAPDAVLRTGLTDTEKISDGNGKVRIITTAPSVDTPVCAVQLRTFNQKATALGDNVEVWYITRDLVPALGRFCAAEGIKGVRVFSDAIEREVGDKWGLTIRELGLLARTAYVVDAKGNITYREIVEEIGDEPNYDKVLEAAKAAL